MSEPDFVYLGPKPLARRTLPQGEDVVSRFPRQEPDAGLLASKVGRDDLRPARMVAVVCLLALPVLAAVAKSCNARADEPRPAPPDVPALLEQLDDVAARALVLRGRVESWKTARVADQVARMHFRGGRR